METLSVYDVQINISSILEKMEKDGKSFLIFRDGKPVADLVPHKTETIVAENKATSLQKLSRQE